MIPRLAQVLDGACASRKSVFDLGLLSFKSNPRTTTDDVKYVALPGTLPLNAQLRLSYMYFPSFPG